MGVTTYPSLCVISLSTMQTEKFPGLGIHSSTRQKKECACFHIFCLYSQMTSVWIEIDIPDICIRQRKSIHMAVSDLVPKTQLIKPYYECALL